ncbi:cytochrome P450 family protein [Pleurotus pulmonarius]
MILVLLAIIVIPFILYRLVHDGAPEGIPRIGKGGGLGYLLTAIRFAIRSEEVIDEGNRIFGGRPYAIPTLTRWLIVLSAEHMETLRSSNDSVFNEPIFVNEFLQLDHTMNNMVQRMPFQVTVVRNELTKGIANFIPGVLDESTLAMKETFHPPSGSEYISLPVFHTMDFVHSLVSFMASLVIYSRLLHWIPDVPGLRSLVYFIASTIGGGPKQPLAFIKPYVARRLEERKLSDDHPFNITEALLDNVPPEVVPDAGDLAMRILYLNFGGLYPTSIYLAQTLFEMAQMPTEDVDSVRDEIKAVLEQEGGWTKSALDKFRKIDSILREVGRVHGLSFFGLGRITIEDGKLPDGAVIPSGYQVVVNLKHFHLDPQVYTDAHIFDPFRFSKLRESEGEGVKYGFTTVDNHFLPFGAGRHACPGRFFASMQLKIMIAIILLNYEFKLPDGQVARPKDVVLDGLVLPPIKEHLLFKPRLEKTEGRFV